MASATVKIVKKYDKIIKLAIINHNKDKNNITEGLSEKELLHVKLIRDSDKTDIIYLLTIEDKKTVWETNNLEDEKISEEIYREFIEDKNINYKKIKNHVDLLVAHFAYVFDFNYNYGLKIIYENKYYNKIYNRFKFKEKSTKDKFENIMNIINKYMKERIKEKI